HSYPQALDWVRTALGAGPNARALFVRGATLHKLKRLVPAMADFQTILARFPASPLRRAAREEIAIIDEAQGNLSAALDQYFELGYQCDIAFFLDGRMSLPEIERYYR